MAATRLGLKLLTIVLLDNGEVGGSLTSSRWRSVSSAAAGIYTTHISTPTGLDFSRAAALYGLEHRCVEEPAGLREALEAALANPLSCIVEVRNERAANVSLHGRVWDAVSATRSRTPEEGTGAPTA